MTFFIIRQSKETTQRDLFTLVETCTEAGFVRADDKLCHPINQLELINITD